MRNARVSARPRKPITETILALHHRGLCVREIARDLSLSGVHVRSALTNYGLRVNRDPKYKRGDCNRAHGIDARILSGEVDKAALVWGLVSSGAPVELAAERAKCGLEEAKRLAAECPKNWSRMQ